MPLNDQRRDTHYMRWCKQQRMIFTNHDFSSRKFLLKNRKACSMSGFSRELMSKRKNKPSCFKMKWMHWKWQGGYSLTFFNKSFVSEKKKVHNIPNRQFLQETDMICGFQGCTFNTFRLLTQYILKPVNWRWRCISKVR